MSREPPPSTPMSPDAGDSSQRSENTSPRWRFSVRDLLIITALVAATVAAWTTLNQDVRYRGRLAIALPMFLLPVLGCPIAMYVSRKWRAGRVRVRLCQRLSPSLHVAWWIPVILLAAMTFVPTWSLPLIGLRAGIVGGGTCGVIYLVWLISVRGFDLCENGVVTACLLYTPWTRFGQLGPDQLHVDADRSVRMRCGHPLLGPNWCIFIAEVPVEQRGAVASLLKEKLGEDAERTPANSGKSVS